MTEGKLQQWWEFSMRCVERLFVPGAALATYMLVPDLPPGTGVVLALFVVLDHKITVLSEKRF